MNVNFSVAMLIQYITSEHSKEMWRKSNPGSKIDIMEEIIDGTLTQTTKNSEEFSTNC